MEFLKNIKILNIPGWLRIAIATLIGSSFILNAYIIWSGFQNKEFKSWVESGAELLSVLLPIVLLSLIIGLANSGVRSLRNRTDRVLTVDIPNQLKIIPDYSNSFDNSKALAKYRQVIVEHNHIKHQCFSDFKIKFPSPQEGLASEILIRIELNVKKVNFNLYLDAEKIEQLILNKPFNYNDLGCHERVRSKFIHSTEGASGLHADSNQQEIRYSFNSQLLPRKIDNKSYICLVASAVVPEDLLWDPSTTLYFCQDMMFMIRAFYTENPNFFT